MASNHRREALFLAVGQGLTAVMTLVVLSVLAHLYDKDQLATYQQTFLVFLVLAPILQLGVAEAIFYFIPIEQNRKRGRLLDATLVLITSASVFSVFILFGGNFLISNWLNNPQIGKLLYWLIPYALTVTPGSIIAPSLIANGEAVRSAWFTIVKECIVGLATLTPALLTMPVETVIISHIIANASMNLIGVRLILLLPGDAKARPNRGAIYELLKFSLPVGVTAMIGRIARQLDKVLVGLFYPPEIFAVFAAGAVELPLIGIATRSISLVKIADLKRAVHRGDIDEALRIFRRIGEVTGYVIIPFTFFFMIEAELIVTVLFSEKYLASSEPLRIYLLLLPTRIVTFGTLMLALNQGKLILFRTAVGLAINFLLSITLIQLIGPNGAALATVTAAFVWGIPISLFFLCRDCQRNVRFFFPTKNLIHTTIFALFPSSLLLFTNYLTKDLSSILRLLIACALFGAIMSIWWGNDRLFSWKTLLKGKSPI